MIFTVDGSAADHFAVARLHRVKVLITGGAGFIGTNLRLRLEAEPRVSHIVVLDDLSSGFSDNLRGVSEKVEFLEGSVNQTELLREGLQGVEAVVHLAARPSVARSIEDPQMTTLANVHGTLSVLEGLRTWAPTAHLVFASSSSVYGSNQTLPKHEQMATFPVSPYAASKLAGEVYSLAYQASFRIPVTAFRFFNVYGPYQRPGHAYAAVVPAFLDALIRGNPLPVHGDGRQTRDFTYVGTLVEAIARTIMGRATSPTPVNLAFGTRINLLDLISEIELLVGKSAEVAHLPSRVGDVRDSQASNESLRALLPGLDATPLQIGLRETYAWMTSHVAAENE
jgi:UDP-glucose 4-epimerase